MTYVLGRKHGQIANNSCPFFENYRIYDTQNIVFFYTIMACVNINEDQQTEQIWYKAPS